MSVISARGLVKAFDDGRGVRRILDGTDLDVDTGEVVAVLGRSGSGKSTLLHLLGGLDRTDSGSIDVAGVRVDRQGERGLTRFRRRHVGFVFQFFHLVPELTGEENVLLPGRLHGSSPQHARRAGELIAWLGLSAVAGRLPQTLSGGEQQRFALARALAGNPTVLLADEPTGNLDAESGAAVLGLLRQVADAGRAVLVVTHEAQAAEMADRVLSLEEGRLVGDAVPDRSGRVSPAVR